MYLQNLNKMPPKLNVKRKRGKKFGEELDEYVHEDHSPDESEIYSL